MYVTINAGDAERRRLMCNASQPRKGYKTIPFSAVVTGQPAQTGQTARKGFKTVPLSSVATGHSAYQPAVPPPLPQYHHTAPAMDPAPSQQPLIGGNYVGTPSQPPVHTMCIIYRNIYMHVFIYSLHMVMSLFILYIELCLCLLFTLDYIFVYTLQ